MVETMEDHSIVRMINWKEKRFFFMNQEWNRRTRRFKLRCSNKKHTKWRLSYHDVHDRLSNYLSHLNKDTTYASAI